jgi:hypothetical protein
MKLKKKKIEIPRLNFFFNFNYLEKVNGVLGTSTIWSSNTIEKLENEPLRSVLHSKYL